MRGYAHRLVGYCLATGERRIWSNATQAASDLATHSQYLIQVVRAKRPFKGWCIADIEDEATAKLMYDTGGKVKLAADKPKGRLVQLRIDSHTVIWVRPEEANEKFAASYKQKLERNNGIDL